MTVAAWPFENADTTETQFSWLFRELQDSGVVGSFGDTTLAVTAPGTGMTVSVAAGRCIGRGFMGENTAALTVPIVAADTAARVDRIVFRIDVSGNTGTIIAVKGTSGSPTPPALVQTDTGVWDVPLGLVAVAGGATTIVSGNVTDDRPWIGHRVGVWDAGRQPGNPRVGRLGFNTTLQAFEAWSGTAWIALTPTTLDASVITTGTLAAARIPNLDAAKITTGALPIARGGTGATTAAAARTALGITASLIPSGGGNVQGDLDYVNSVATAANTSAGSAYSLASTANTAANGAASAAAAAQARANACTLDIAYGSGTVRHSRGPDPTAYGRTVGSSYYAVYMDSGLEFGRNVSSARYKDQIRPSEDDGLGVDALAAAVLALEPRTFVRKADTKGHRDLGLIAEEVEEVAPWLVIHEQATEDVKVQAVEPDGTPKVHRNGKPVMVTERRPIEGTRVPEGVAYETTLVVALVGAVKHLAARVTELESAR